MNDNIKNIEKNFSNIYIFTFLELFILNIIYLKYFVNIINSINLFGNVMLII